MNTIVKLFIIFCALPLLALAQPTAISGRVFDQKTGEALPFVNITINNSRQGTAADVDGRFEFNAGEPITNITFSFVGYEKFTMPISANTHVPLEVYMKEVSTTLQEVEVIAGENPAHRIINNAVANRSKNDPTNLSSFSYKSYNKLIITIEADSLPLIDENGNPDSSNIELQEFMDTQHLFIMESASERKYKKPDKDNEIITANRVSGLQNPTFVLLANQLQSFSFYSDFITVLSDDYLNPISKGSTRKYLFLMQDTTVSGSDTTFVISFAPFGGYRFQPLKGLLYINTNGWAIQNVVAEPVEQEGFDIRIQQRYEQFEGGSWFPVQMNYDFRFSSIKVNEIQPVGIGRTYLSDIKINPALEKKEFIPVEVKINADATRKEDSFWNNYRVDTLDRKEKETYRVIDSIGEAENFEQKLKWIQALSIGKFRWKYVDFPIKHLLRYNIYEGLRLGFGAETNPMLSEWFMIGGYAAYGFKDKVAKYGYYGEIKLHNNSNLKLGGGYRFDIFESGGIQWIDEPEKSILVGGDTRILWIQQFDQLSEAYGYLTWHPLPNIHTKLQISRQNRFMPGNYAYLTSTTEGIEVWQNGFVAGLVQASVEWAPNDKYMEDQYGRRPMQRTFPVFSAQYTKGIDGFLDGTLDFNRLDLKVRYDFKTKELGITGLEFAAGQVFGDVPYSYLYNGRSNLPNSQTNVGPIYIADQWSFETMRNNEFLNDQYVQVMFRQNLQSRVLKIKNWAPDFEFVARALWGRLEKPEVHRGIESKDATQGFYESGIEINKILSGLGIGFYYRFGPNQLPSYADNWSVKMSYRVTLFQ